jgi:hypothetical protein
MEEEMEVTEPTPYEQYSFSDASCAFLEEQWGAGFLIRRGLDGVRQGDLKTNQREVSRAS